MIGTYYRLSLADEDVGTDKTESNSIQGQRGLVEGYIMARPELATEPRQEYVDDGYSGTSTSRPAFQRLIQDAQDGKVKTIIVKDFSRFARDYIEAGDYMERIFPLLGVRFISVNDGYDSGMQIRNDVCGLEVAIKNIINASYSRDLSAKIAAADHVMQKKGMYLGGYRPFGFLPDPSDCHKLILDPVASRYVRLIFELALQGNRTGTIAKILNEKQIPTPAAYHVAESHVYSEQKAWDAYRVQEDEKMEQIQRLRAEKNQTFQPVKKDTDNLQAVMNTVGEAGDVMHLSQNVVETFIDRIEVFNDKRVKIHFTFEDVLAGYAE